MRLWLAMPTGPEAIRCAAFDEADASLCAIRCALLLLKPGAASARDRQLLGAIDDELARISRALRLLSGR